MRKYMYKDRINNFNKYSIPKILKLRNMLPSDILAWSAHVKAASPFGFAQKMLVFPPHPSPSGETECR